MVFAWPWAFLGLAALPALAVIYWLRQRAQRLPVSSLLLWRDAPPSREGGRRFERFEAPPLFFVELLILALLVLAAAGPRVPTPDSHRPLVAVLDDSFSMQARVGQLERRRVALEDAAVVVEQVEVERAGGVALVAALVAPRPAN